MDILECIFTTDVKYLGKKHLTGFRNYKYSSVDTNPIGTYVMHPFWDWLINFFPRYIAPNLITLTGFLFVVQSFILMSYYDYNFYASSYDRPDYQYVRNWVFFVIAVNIFLSYTLDGIDGKQARRTNTSGPLGELFDHGLDSWTTIFIPVLLYSIFGRLDSSVPPARLYYICCTIFINFYLSHVEKYNTGVLYLPWSYDLSMLGSVLIFLATSIIGYDGWKHRIFGKYSAGQLLEFIFYSSTVIFNIPMVLRSINAYREGKSRTLYEALRPLIPVTLFLTLSTYWMCYSPTNIIERDPRIFYLTCGNIFSNICCRLIISQMSNTRCEVSNFLLFPLAFVILVSMVIPSLELFLLYFMFLFSIVYHIRFGVCVVNQLCQHFGIQCFHIPSS